MAKVHPQLVSSCTSSKQEVFTLWMKSLIMSTNGCAVFDSNGCIVFRVDNYSHRCTTQICIMDATGKVLLTILKKQKFSLFKTWEGYRSTTSTEGGKKKPVFQVRKLMGIRAFLGYLRGYSICKALIRVDEDKVCEYRMEIKSCKQSWRIVDAFGGLVAEVKRKITRSGVVLGEDVLTMVVEPHIDHSLVMGLVLVM
ncbi:protein LURP-one-related 11-like isoform X1 [Salvia splendens]|uniref:protein LURP-one-related 11-like isoform X1 n=1 Tax=Salvia splendens TaxID=180675 RepID=UPI001C27608E|nr:protein LURP-one-related 11-like isoform X1 [Salvia splendens]